MALEVSYKEICANLRDDAVCNFCPHKVYAVNYYR